MKIALNSDGKSIRPFPSGRGTCPVCKTDVRAHCGEIYEWHWHHEEDVHCDYYWEPETHWHRKWKSHFPATCVEVVITKDGETHIADVQSTSGLVIEFQNSSISPHTIRVREEFYENMIWVVNAESFKDHFKVRSVVNTELRELDSDYKWKKKNVKIDEEFTDKVKHFEQRIKQIEGEIRSQEYKWRSLTNDLGKVQESLEAMDELTVRVINRLTSGDYLFEYHIRDIIEAIETKYKATFKEIPIKIETLKKAKTEYQGKKLYFENLKTYQHDGINYRLVEYNALKNAPEEQIKNIIAIKKSTAYNLFTEVKTFTTRQSYIGFEFTARDYLIAFNPTEVITRYDQMLTDTDNQIFQFETQFQDAKNSLKLDLETLLPKWQNELVEQVAQINILLADLRLKLPSIEEELSKARIAKENEEQKELNRIEKEYNYKRFEIMRENKGQYTFNWKNERKSWQAADCTIYFDIGKEYLFKKVYDGGFEKIRIDEFLAMYSR